jgi:predicted alpha/beta hydrolase
VSAVDAEMPAADDGLAVAADDMHQFRLLQRAPATPHAALLWLPALGVAARHYLPFAEALAERGIAVFVHEWRGHGSSNLRAGHTVDWGYRELLERDLPASARVIHEQFPSLPKIIGGHSLGGQLAACLLALQPQTAQRLWLVASGSPFWRIFPQSRGWLLPLAYRFLPWLADRMGSLPGRSIGFGGKEARGVMHDWTRTGLSGRYAGKDMATDLETALLHVQVEVDAVRLAEDWLVPAASLHFLLKKIQPSAVRIDTINPNQLGTRADHFAWMTQPYAVADALTATISRNASAKKNAKHSVAATCALDTPTDKS